MASFWDILIALGIVFLFCPLLGKMIYNLDNRLALLFYCIISIIVTFLLYLATDHPPLIEVQTNMENYWNEIKDIRGIFIFSIITYVVSGIGVIGGTLEFAGENIEKEDLYKSLKALSPIKLYILNCIYGFIFLFAVFAFSQFLMELLQWQFRGNASIIRRVTDLMLFRSIVLPILGSLLFAIKSFKYGPFSIEFYRSDFHPSVADIGLFQKESRHFFACILGAITIYFSAFLYFIEQKTPQSDAILSQGKAIFYLMAAIEAILFYILKHRFIDQLKPLKKRYSLKVGGGNVDSIDIDNTTIQKADADLRFDD